MTRRFRQTGGQSLVLMALTMLLLTLLVLLTLSFAWRVRDRIETQITADAAAYSQSVAVARTFNEVALMNRSIIALTVSTMGMQSLMSWSSHHRANVQGLLDALEMILGEYEAECNPFNPCPCIQIPIVAAAIGGVQQYQAQLASIWDGLEQPAADQAHSAWQAARDLELREFDAWDKMNTLVQQQQYAQLTASLVNADELKAVSDGDAKSKAELGDIRGTCQANQAICQAQKDDDYSDMVPVMGSRGFAFVHARAGGYDPIRQKLESIVQRYQPGSTTQPSAGVGGTGQGAQRHAQTTGTLDWNGFDWAEDHGQAPVLSEFWNAPGCPAAGVGSVPPSFVAGGTPGNNTHQFRGGFDSDPRRHKLSDDNTLWNRFGEFNFHEITKPGNDFGQPTLYSIIQRDYSQTKAKPWDMRFTFQLSRSGNGEAFDDNGPNSAFRSPDGADLKTQVALGASIVYYHRPGKWAEPPNLFNPFWRATLASANTDAPQYLRQAGYDQHGDTLEQLSNAGWRGMR